MSALDGIAATFAHREFFSVRLWLCENSPSGKCSEQNSLAWLSTRRAQHDLTLPACNLLCVVLRVPHALSVRAAKTQSGFSDHLAFTPAGTLIGPPACRQTKPQPREHR